MISQKYRLTRNQIQYILKKGESSISKLFIIRYIRNQEDHNRYCVITSKKIYAKAVERNHLRRQIYEAIRLVEKECETLKETHTDIALIPKKKITNEFYKEIEEDLRAIIKKHG